MSDEAIVEAVLKGMWKGVSVPLSDDPNDNVMQRMWLTKARQALASLRSEGWELYRPDECEIEPISEMNVIPATDPIPDGWNLLVEASDRNVIGRKVGERVILRTSSGHPPESDVLAVGEGS